MYTHKGTYTALTYEDLARHLEVKQSAALRCCLCPEGQSRSLLNTLRCVVVKCMLLGLACADILAPAASTQYSRCRSNARQFYATPVCATEFTSGSRSCTIGYNLFLRKKKKICSNRFLKEKKLDNRKCYTLQKVISALKK